MRAMAGELGITHQKLGRWLRGETQVPADAFTSRGVTIVFNQHIARVKRANKIQDLPWLGPVYLDRRPLRDGKPGDRVVIHHTQYLGADIRALIIAAVQGSREFFGLSVRSIVDLATYWNRAEDAFKDSGRRIRTESEQANREHLRYQIRTGLALKPIYTKYVNVGKYSNAGEAIRQTEQRLREKHEPAASIPGTVVADEILLQLYPLTYAARPEPKRSRAVSKRIRRTGGK